jgi:hypothetical protein
MKEESLFAHYWRGHGPLWKVYWLYGVLGSWILTAILLIILGRGLTAGFLFQIVLILLAVYTVWIVVSVWRCAFNVENENYAYIARALTVAWAINAALVLGFLELELIKRLG